MDGSSATLAYEAFRWSYLDTKRACQEEGVTFIPMIIEADGGGWGPSAISVLSEIAKQKAILTGELSSTVANRLFQSLGVILHRENARATLRRSPNTAESCGSELLTTSVVCNIPASIEN